MRISQEGNPRRAVCQPPTPDNGREHSSECTSHTLVPSVKSDAVWCQLPKSHHQTPDNAGECKEEKEQPSTRHCHTHSLLSSVPPDSRTTTPASVRQQDKNAGHYVQ